MPIRALCWITAAALGLSLPAPASAAAAQPPSPAKPPAAEPVPVTRAQSPIRVDGVLDEAIWAEAEVIAVPWEFSPADNAAAPVDTEVRLAYDDEHFYVAFVAHDPEPQRIRARYADRDTAFGDDLVGFMVDPVHDQRRGYQFRINPLGVQLDAVNSDVENREDWSWDAIWESAGRITESGYVVEAAVPFRELRLASGAGPQTWGFLAFRDWPRSERHRLRSIWTDKDRSCLVCQFQEVTGFESLERGRDLVLTPSLTGNLREARTVGERFATEDEELELGLTAEWGIRPDLSLHAALNPDFSQVEADAAQLDVNTRFALFFPEKRPFFLEGLEVFQSHLDLVFTRTVADPIAGIKLAGKEGANAYGAFLTQDRINNLVVPGPQSSQLVSFDDEVTGGVLRYTRDLGERSSLGALYTGRLADGYHNHLFSVDGLTRLSDSDTLRYQAMGSSTRYPEDLVLGFDQPEGAFTGHGLLLDYRHSDSRWFWFGQYSQLSPEMRADFGFMPQVGARQVAGGVERRIPGEGHDWFSNVWIFLGFDGTREWDGAWNEWGSDLVVSYQGPRQSSLSLAVAPNQEFFAGTTYHNTRYSVGGEIQPTPDLEVDLRVRWGEAIDFANRRQAEFVTVSPSVELNVGRRFLGVLSYDRQTFETTAGQRVFTLDLPQARLFYHFGRRAFLRAILQYRRLEREPESWTFPVDSRDERLLSQLLFSYRLDAQTVFLIGYSDGHLGDDAFSLTQTERTLFLKLSYAWLR